MASRIAEGRASILPADLLDACLYELGALELGEPTKRIILEELGVTDVISCDEPEQFAEVASRVLQLITSAREFQFA